MDESPPPMEDSPPPMDEVDMGSEKEDDDGDDLFGKKDDPLVADTLADVQAETKEEEKPPEPAASAAPIPAPTLEATAAEESPKPVKKDTVETAKPLDLFGDDNAESEQVCHYA